MTARPRLARLRPFAGQVRRVVQHGLLALGLVTSTWADAYTLDALLRLPLERLLQLQITPRRTAALAPRSAIAEGSQRVA